MAENFPELKKDMEPDNFEAEEQGDRDHLSDVKIHYKVVRIRTVCSWPRERERDQCNKSEGSKFGYMAAQCIAEMVWRVIWE